MSQEQWNERERSKRNMEFAPMPTETVGRHSNLFNRQSHATVYEECENRTLNFTTKKRKLFFTLILYREFSSYLFGFNFLHCSLGIFTRTIYCRTNTK